MSDRMIRVLDRSDYIEPLKAALEIDPKRTALVAIDMHRGHLDPEVATMPVPAAEARRVLDNAERLWTVARRFEIPIIHVVVQHRNMPGDKANYSARNPNRRLAKRLGVYTGVVPPASTASHNIAGAAGTEIMPEVALEPGDYLVDSKRRLSSFHGTDLEIVLSSLEVNTLIIVGINTNSCVLCAAFEAHNRDFAPIVISDCVASLYGEDLHVFALENISRALGWVLTVDELQAKLEARAGAGASSRN